MTHPLAMLLNRIIADHEVPWSEKRPLNDAAKDVVRAALAETQPLRARRRNLNGVAEALLEETQQVDAAIEAGKRKFFDAIAEAQPELKGECLLINNDDFTYQTHDHGPKPQAPKPPPWVDEYLNPKKGNGNG